MPYRTSSPPAQPTHASLSAVAPDGQLVTIIDRAPRAGERGFWVSAEFQSTLAEKLTCVIRNQTAPGEYGWEANVGELYWDPEENLHTVTVTVTRGSIPIEHTREDIEWLLEAVNAALYRAVPPNYRNGGSVMDPREFVGFRQNHDVEVITLIERSKKMEAKLSEALAYFEVVA